MGENEHIESIISHSFKIFMRLTVTIYGELFALEIVVKSLIFEISVFVCLLIILITAGTLIVKRIQLIIPVKFHYLITLMLNAFFILYNHS